jgi:hypothetical protein
MSSLIIAPRSLTTTTSHLEIAFTVTNPASATTAVEAGNPIAPATYLQLSFDFGDDMVVFPDNAIFTPRDVVTAREGQNGDKMIRLERKEIPKQTKGNAVPEVKVYAWKGEKMLEGWVVGRLAAQEQMALR